MLAGGAALAFVAFALGLLPRETRMLERLGEGRSAVELDDKPRGLANRS